MSLQVRFARRMAPLAIIVGIVVAVVPPLTYRLVAWDKLSEQAQVYAGHIAQGIRDAVYRQPLLWRYNAPKILHATLLHRDQHDISSIEILDCTGEIVLHSGHPSTDRAAEPQGMVTVYRHGQAAAFVSVHIDSTAHEHALMAIALFSIPLGILMAILSYWYPTRVVRRQSRRLLDTNERLQTARDALASANEGLNQKVNAGAERIRALSSRVVQIQEDERRRIARDLHDGLGQAITGLQMELELALTHPEGCRVRLGTGIQMCTETIADLRRVVQEIRPPELDTSDIPETLRTYAEQFEERTGITTYFHARGKRACGVEVGLCLFRLLQEGLTNIKRHAQASEIGINVHIHDTGVTMQITDDGSGFDATKSTTGTGLTGMQERCAFLNGTAEFESAPGLGTTLEFNIPLSRGTT